MSGARGESLQHRQNESGEGRSARRDRRRRFSEPASRSQKLDGAGGSKGIRSRRQSPTRNQLRSDESDSFGIGSRIVGRRGGGSDGGRQRDDRGKTEAGRPIAVGLQHGGAPGQCRRISFRWIEPGQRGFGNRDRSPSPGGGLQARCRPAARPNLDQGNAASLAASRSAARRRFQRGSGSVHGRGAKNR